MSKMKRAKSYIGKVVVTDTHCLRVKDVVVDNNKLHFKGRLLNQDGTEIDRVDQARDWVNHMTQRVLEVKEEVTSGDYIPFGMSGEEYILAVQQSLESAKRELDNILNGTVDLDKDLVRINSKVKYKTL